MTISTTTPKFQNPDVTARNEPRAKVPMRALETLWFNTGTLCNIACANCYIESSPRNDRLAFLRLADVSGYLDEIARDALPVKLVGFTGGEPFANREMPAILNAVLERGFETLVLTNAMKPMMLKAAEIEALIARFGRRLRLRVSLDDYRAEVHDRERGEDSFDKSLAGLIWLARAGARVEVAGRFLSGDDEAAIRAGFGQLFAAHGIALDCQDEQDLVLFPEMQADGDPPEISERCWGILKRDPAALMCASARMVVRRRDSEHASVTACTLLPYDARFDLGQTLAEAAAPVPLNHPFCATFCVLGGASCGAGRG